MVLKKLLLFRFLRTSCCKAENCRRDLWH